MHKIAHERVRHAGQFRVLSWRDGEQWAEAQAFRLANPDRLDDYYNMADSRYRLRNTGVSAGLNLLLSAGVGIGGAVFDSTKAFLGIGNGQVATTANGAIAAGAASITFASATGFAAGDEVLLTDSTGSGLGTNPERVFLGAPTGAVFPLVKPTRFAHLTATKIVRHGSRIDTDLPSGSKWYKGVDAGFPTQGVRDGNSVLTWQSTYDASEALFVWNAVCIGQTTGTQPNSHGEGVGVNALPASSQLLAVGAWVPAPFEKMGSIQSLAYELAFDVAGRV